MRARLLLALVPFLLLVGLAWEGIDYGFHWDEDFNKINAVVYSLEHDGTLLPDGYTYPSVNYWLTVATLTPEIVQTAHRSGLEGQAYQAALVPVLRSHAFLLRLRRVYSAVTALTAVWIFLTVWAWGGGICLACVGGILLATTFEVIYHARWVAPDTILMQFGALTLLLLVLAWKRGWAPATRLAAVAAGLACGTKYPGALLMAPVLALPLLRVTPSGGWSRAVREAVVLGAIFLGTYLLTTPGTVLQPLIFLNALRAARRVYAEGWYGYTVTPGISHLRKIAVYFSTAVFSTFRPIAIGWFALVVAGIGAVWRGGWRFAMLVLLFPLLYVPYFSVQATMVVRNYLVLVPFAVFLLILGIAEIDRRLSTRALRIGFVSLLTLALAVDLVDQVRASATVARRGDTPGFVADFARYADRHPLRLFLISPQLAAALRSQGLWSKPNFRLASNAVGRYHEYVSFYTETVPPHESWPTNRPGTFKAVFGPRDVNMDYYTGWPGGERVISLTSVTMAEMELTPAPAAPPIPASPPPPAAAKN